MQNQFCRFFFFSSSLLLLVLLELSDDRASNSPIYWRQSQHIWTPPSSQVSTLHLSCLSGIQKRPGCSFSAVLNIQVPVSIRFFFSYCCLTCQTKSDPLSIRTWWVFISAAQFQFTVTITFKQIYLTTSRLVGGTSLSREYNQHILSPNDRTYTMTNRVIKVIPENYSDSVTNSSTLSIEV